MLRFARQPTLLVLAFWLEDALTPAQQSAYLTDGPTATTRNPDGSGTLRLVVDGQVAVVDVPAGSTWVEVRPLTDDDELAAYAEAEPLDIAGAQVSAQLDRGRETARLLARGQIDQWLKAWEATHRLSWTCADEPGDEHLPAEDLRRARSVRNSAARAALLDMIVRAVRWPMVGEHRDRLLQLAGDADGELERAVRRALDGMPASLSMGSLDAADLMAVRQHNAYDKRLARAKARRGLVALHHPDADGRDRSAMWDLIDQAPQEVRDPVVAEIYAHVDRIGTASPKAEPASSPACG